jgi:hypothetical protein
MAIDVSFLLEFLQTFSKNNNERTLQRIPSRMSHLVDPSCRKSCHSILLRDIVMLENQVPLFLLRKAVELRCSEAQHVLTSMLIGFFQEVSTFRGIGYPCIDTNQHVHLLDFLYSNMVPRRTESDGTTTEEAQAESHCKDDHHRKRNAVMKFLVRRGSKLMSVVMDFTMRILLKFVASLPCLSMLSQPLEQLTQLASEPCPASDVQNKNLSPLLEEIAVPSVTELAYAGVKFCPTVGDLSMITFSSEIATLHLPVIGIDVNSEILLRNLVAYEASACTGPLVLARYVELMNGIIDTEEDARLLREHGIILNYLKSDQEVAELWNGMTRSVRLTNVPALDKVIDGLNKHYNTCWKVKIRMFVKAQIAGSRELLGCVAVLVLFLFLSLQAFCTFRLCRRQH